MERILNSMMKTYGALLTLCLGLISPLVAQQEQFEQAVDTYYQTYANMEGQMLAHSMIQFDEEEITLDVEYLKSSDALRVKDEYGDIQLVTPSTYITLSFHEKELSFKVLNTKEEKALKESMYQQKLGLSIADQLQGVQFKQRTKEILDIYELIFPAGSLIAKGIFSFHKTTGLLVEVTYEYTQSTGDIIATTKLEYNKLNESMKEFLSSEFYIQKENGSIQPTSAFENFQVYLR